VSPYLLNLGYSNAQGHTNPFRGSREKIQTEFFSVARTKVTAIYTAMLLSIELRRVRRILRIHRISFSPSTAIRRITDLDTAVDAENR
jgi:hypothetical protein